MQASYLSQESRGLLASCRNLCWILLFIFSVLFAHGQISVSNVQATQRPGTDLVDIDYDLTGIDTPVAVSLEFLPYGNSTLTMQPSSLTGAIGSNVTPATGLRITWDASADWDNQWSSQCRFRITVGSNQTAPVIDGLTEIPAGPFQMGDAFGEAGSEELPVHTVNLSKFYIARHEVTKQLWDDVCSWGISNGYADLPSGVGKSSSYPVHGISWYSALKWCNARSEKENLEPCYEIAGAVYKTGNSTATCNWSANGYRLPTEAEWEKSARGGRNELRYSWGNIINHGLANFNNSGNETYQNGTKSYHPTYNDGTIPYTSPVGSFSPNDYGLYDVSGNVLEFCWDLYSTTYYSTSPEINPYGPISGSSRVVRGGNWNLNANGCRLSRRFQAAPTTTAYFGFRVVRSGSSAASGISELVSLDTREWVFLTITPVVHGAISGNNTDGKYLVGDAVNLTAVPNPGFSFDGWSGDASGTTNPLTLLLDSNKTIGASFSPDIADTDDDGMPNWWEVANNLNPEVNDASSDADSDEVSNLEEFRLSFNPRDSDSDDDDLLDKAEDTDGDNLPDVWELRIGLNRLYPDTDSDGVTDADEDSDGDGLSNRWELALTTSPLLQDSDGNGTSDSMEDADGDGLSNGWEIRYGLDPLISDKNQTGDGSDGPLDVLAGVTQVFAPWATSVTGTNASGAVRIGIANASGFTVNDLVLLWVAQDSDPVPMSNTAGRYQICRVTATTANTLSLLQPLKWDFNAGSGRIILIQKIPEYTTVKINGTLEPTAWNGSNGGVLAFCARDLVIGPSGLIHANGKGFRGGSDYAQADVDGFQGESYLGGYGVRSVNSNGGGGGGGGRSWQYAGNGGGGGGFGLGGTNGGFLSNNITDRPTARIGGAGGNSYGFADCSTMLLGSGGGSGGQDGDNPNDGQMNGGSGGNGGGIVLVLATRFENGGGLSANGANGSNGVEERGAGGGGSGGVVYLVANYSGPGALAAAAGSGGSGSTPEIFGGIGAVGRIRMDLKDGATPPSSAPPVGYSGEFLDAFSETGLGLGSYDDADLDGLNSLEESQADTDPFAIDTDGDGMPDGWEVDNGTNPKQPDTTADADADGVTNIQELHLGTAANKADTDGDGLNDGIESGTSGTNPLSTDSDGDGMPDKWEIDHGLDARRDDRSDDRDFDFLTNWEEFLAGLNPASADSDGNGVTDYRQVNGKTSWDALYDRTDRLMGVRHERGASFGYQYDGNSNLIRQVKLGRDDDNDGLSDLWEFSNGLDHKSAVGADGLIGDLDGDGWTNFQELTAGSNPASAADKPGRHGKVLPSIPFPFTPTRFVMGTGQLDNAGSEEIVVSADGDPAGSANFLRLYREGDEGWVHEDIPVGDYGVTSLAIGVVSGQQGAIFAGLRKNGGAGRVIAISRVGTIWQTTVVSESLSAEAWVHGIRSTPTGSELMLSLFTRYGPGGGLYRATVNESGWGLSLINSLASNTGEASVSTSLITAGFDTLVRRLDTGGVQLLQGFSYPTPNFDEFDGTVLESPPWTSGGSPLPTESSGLARLETSWGSGGSASSWSEADLQWPKETSAIEIRVAFAQHSQASSTRFGGECRILIGPTSVYSSGQNRSESNIDVQVLRGPTKVFFRRRVNGGAWSDWGSGDTGPKLRLEAYGSDVGSSSYDGYVKMHVDYVRYRSSSDALAQGSSINDFGTTEGAYRASSNAWFFKTPVTMNLRDAQSYAFVRGGDLVSVTDSNLNSWLQGKFSGDFWIGYYRRTAGQPWQWLNNANSPFTGWSAGQPESTDDQLYAFANSGVWSSATGGEMKAGVYQMRSPIAEFESKVIAGISGTTPIAWLGRNADLGRFNPSNVTENSLVQVGIDDMDLSGNFTQGDEFVVEETVVGPVGTVRTSIRRRVTATASPGFGVASLRTKRGTSDVLAIAEPDGEVTLWSQAIAGGPLKRRVLSLDHVGAGWHGLGRFTMAGKAQALAGLRTHADTPSSVELVIWSDMELDFVTPPVIQQSLPTARLLASPAEGGLSAPLFARLWDSEGNFAKLALQFKNPTSGVWQDGAISQINGNPPLSSYHLATGPAGVTHTLVWNAGQDLSSDFRGSVMLRVQAADNSGSGAWSEPLAYTIIGTTDADGDGIPDSWETLHGLNHNSADALLDNDLDGVENLMEFALGMNPGISDLHLLPKLTIEGGFATLTIDRNPDASALMFTPEWSADLSFWNHGTEFFTVLEDTPSRLKIRFNHTISERSMLHLRVKVGR